MKENLEKRERENTADKLLNFRPVFFVAVFLCLGIVFSYVCTFNGVSPWWGLLVLPLIGALVLLCDVTSVKKTALTVSALLVAFLCGFTSFHTRTENYLQKTVMDGEYAVCGVVEYKRENEFGLELILSSVTVGENEQKGKLIAYLPSSFSENVRLADKVLLEGMVMENREFSAYSADENIRFTMYADGMVVVEKEFHLFLLIRDRLESVIYENMEESAAALTVAVLTGNTDGISDGLLSNMRYGGIAHIFAVSGLHVSALYGFCSMLINKTKLRKLPKLARFFSNRNPIAWLRRRLRIFRVDYKSVGDLPCSLSGEADRDCFGYDGKRGRGGYRGASSLSVRSVHGGVSALLCGVFGDCLARSTDYKRVLFPFGKAISKF